MKTLKKSTRAIRNATRSVRCNLPGITVIRRELRMATPRDGEAARLLSSLDSCRTGYVMSCGAPWSISYYNGVENAAINLGDAYSNAVVWRAHNAPVSADKCRDLAQQLVRKAHMPTNAPRRCFAYDLLRGPNWTLPDYTAIHGALLRAAHSDGNAASLLSSLDKGWNEYVKIRDSNAEYDANLERAAHELAEAYCRAAAWHTYTDLTAPNRREVVAQALADTIETTPNADRAYMVFAELKGLADIAGVSDTLFSTAVHDLDKLRQAYATSVAKGNHDRLVHGETTNPVTLDLMRLAACGRRSLLGRIRWAVRRARHRLREIRNVLAIGHIGSEARAEDPVTAEEFERLAREVRRLLLARIPAAA